MVGLAKLGGDTAPGSDAWMWKSLSFRCPGEALGFILGGFWRPWGDFQSTGKRLEFGRTPWGPNLDFRVFFMDFGSPGDPLWSHFDDLFAIWTTQLQCGFQNGFFCDLGMDRAPGRHAWMCLKHSKYDGFC